jgi:hypothetical protein
LKEKDTAAASNVVAAPKNGPPPPVPAKPKIKLTQKIGRFIKGSSSKPAASPAAKEFIYRRPSSKTSPASSNEPAVEDVKPSIEKEDDELESNLNVRD